MNINKKIIAVDIGGTNIRVGITNPDGKILKKYLLRMMEIKICQLLLKKYYPKF